MDIIEFFCVLPILSLLVLVHVDQVMHLVLVKAVTRTQHHWCAGRVLRHLTLDDVGLLHLVSVRLQHMVMTALLDATGKLRLDLTNTVLQLQMVVLILLILLLLASLLFFAHLLQLFDLADEVGAYNLLHRFGIILSSNFKIWLTFVLGETVFAISPFGQ
jgi:hypothetical protein